MLAIRLLACWLSGSWLMPDQRVAAQPILHPAYTVFMGAHHAATRAGARRPAAGALPQRLCGHPGPAGDARARASAQLHRPASPKSYSTPKVMERLLANPRNRVDQRAVLRARLLDMILADWDRRHDDQWHWLAYPRPGGGLPEQPGGQTPGATSRTGAFCALAATVRADSGRVICRRDDHQNEAAGGENGEDVPSQDCHGAHRRPRDSVNLPWPGNQDPMPPRPSDRPLEAFITGRNKGNNSSWFRKNSCCVRAVISPISATRLTFGRRLFPCARVG